MGTYTEFYFRCRIRHDTPESILNVLRYMSDPIMAKHPFFLPKHDFFKCRMWRYLFTAESTRIETFMESIDDEHHIKIEVNIKNYDDEIQLFLNWINSYIYHSGYPVSHFLGYYITDSDDCDLINIIFINDRGTILVNRYHL